MRSWVLKHENQFLLLILIISGVMRFYQYDGFSFMNDELSAINRLRFSSLSELIEKGVKVDGHPAGVQLFLYYWVKVAGATEAMVRIPFIICGIISVLMIYLIGKSWFGIFTGLFSAISLGFLDYFILYSRIARPYSPGLMFTLLTAYFWGKLFFEKDKSSIFNKAGLLLSLTGAAYTHHFSFLGVIIIAGSGIFLKKSVNFKSFLIILFMGVALYIPHLTVLLSQLKMGGIGEWLAVPSLFFIRDFFIYAFNGSVLIISTMILIFITSILKRKSPAEGIFLKRLLLICWFIIPFLIEYLYSIYKNPVLQFSGLIFCFPFFLIFIFSFLNFRPIVSYLLGFMLMCILTWSTVIGNEFYKKEHFGVFRDLAQDIKAWREKYGMEVPVITNLNNGYYLDHYFGPVNSFMEINSGEADQMVKLSSAIKDIPSDYLVYVWSTTYSPPELPDIIRQYFPYVIKRNGHFNSESWLFSKKDEEHIIEEPLLYSSNGFEGEVPFWGNCNSTEKINFKSGQFSCKLDSLNQYGPSFTYNPGILENPSDYFIVFKGLFMCYEQNPEGILVITFENEGKVAEWMGGEINSFLEPGVWKKAYYGRVLPKGPGKEWDTIKAYVWNNGKKTIFMDDLEISIYYRPGIYP